MWKSLDSLRETVREGLQEFSRDAIHETSLLKTSVVQNVAQAEVLRERRCKLKDKSSGATWGSSGGSGEEEGVEFGVGSNGTKVRRAEP